MTSLFATFLWRVAIIAGIVAVLIVVAMLARAIRALRHKVRSRGRQVSHSPFAETTPAVPDAMELPIPRHSSPARPPAARDVAQNDIFRDAA